MAVFAGASAGGVAGQLSWKDVGEIGGQVTGGLVGGIAWSIWLVTERKKESKPPISGMTHLPACRLVHECTQSAGNGASPNTTVSSGGSSQVVGIEGETSSPTGEPQGGDRHCENGPK